MNETIEIIKSLKTVRKFSDKNISEDNLELILKSCVNAATASARQTYSIIVVEDKKVMKKIGYVGDKMLVFCVDFNRVIDSAEYLEFQYKHEIPIVAFITGSTDTILAAQTAAITAKSLGIDSFFSNCVHRGNINRIYDCLNLPKKYCFPIAALMLGYSDDEKIKLTKKGRLSGEGVIHFNKYKRLNDEELKNIVLEYDSEDKHFLSLIDDWREKGYKHYLEYFYEKWCGCSRTNEKSDNQIESNSQYSEVEKMLVKTGFLCKFIKYDSSKRANESYR
ncbi:nitroreductase [Clostridium carboxidivorans P7]|uniref:Nitroreductase n=1 Tax=Clostridium carboxidivorans P7 TaxID=536227 RepID=C6PSP4_9CLOT|nr:nitroreductase family protein [Clostridium carboxidivorans]AKN34167.1 nitroreductase [Clostridium carboxidivorans P7]EET87723.1 nitroreductase [Clostridium carboxidivorans P7]